MTCDRRITYIRILTNHMRLEERTYTGVAPFNKANFTLSK